MLASSAVKFFSQAGFTSCEHTVTSASMSRSRRGMGSRNSGIRYLSATGSILERIVVLLIQTLEVPRINCLTVSCGARPMAGRVAFTVWSERVYGRDNENGDQDQAAMSHLVLPESNCRSLLYSPQTLRKRLLIHRRSPALRTHSSMRGTRFSVPAAASSSSGASRCGNESLRLRTARRRSTCWCSKPDQCAELEKGFLFTLKTIDADNYRFFTLNRFLIAVSRFLNSFCTYRSQSRATFHRARLFSRDSCWPILNLIRQMLDCVSAAQRIGDVGHARLVSESLVGCAGRAAPLLPSAGPGLHPSHSCAAMCPARTAASA